MRCAPAIVLRSSNAVEQGVHQLHDVADDMVVVVVHDGDGETLYFTYSAAALRTRLSTASRGTDIAMALSLNEFPEAKAVQLSDTLLPLGSVALEGRQVVGVISDEHDSPIIDAEAVKVRGGISLRDVQPRPGVGARLRPPITVRDDAVITRGITSPDIEADADIVATPLDPAPPHDGLFRAYPDVQAPGQVGSGQRFTVSVGFAEAPSPTMLIQGPPIMVITGPRAEFILQVSGFGFTFPEGIQRPLTVDRDNPASARAEFAVIADSAETAAPRVLEISYEFAGAVVGRTWAQVQVIPQPRVESPEPATAGGSGLIAESADRTAPHLSVDIFSENGGSELSWVFHTCYSQIARPAGAVSTSLDDDSARSFAVQLMKQIPALQQGPYLAATMQGVGKRVADILPTEFWSVLAQAWRRARTDNEQPRMQITLTEPWIPWELAWIDSDRFDGAADLLPEDCPDGAPLGQLWQVARWTTPVRHLVSGDVPAAPPASQCDADKMVVIIGNYPKLPGLAQLPHAVEEGNSIALTYGALPLPVTDAAVATLMDCALQRDGQDFEPTVIHFAGHGQTDVNNPQFTGLVLADGRRLDPVAVGGFRLVAKERPFVFLNACEAGVAGQTLMNLGGLVGAFLVEGARGFVAPLWKVDDVTAREIAFEFYRRTLVDGETVSEAIRQIRRGFTPLSTSATALAYVFYGNPDLRLVRGAV